MRTSTRTTWIEPTKKEYVLSVHEGKQSSVEYLGYVIDANWLHTAALKLTVIADALPPQNITLLPK